MQKGFFRLGHSPNEESIKQIKNLRNFTYKNGFAQRCSYQYVDLSEIYWSDYEDFSFS